MSDRSALLYVAVDACRLALTHSRRWGAARREGEMRTALAPPRGHRGLPDLTLIREREYGLQHTAARISRLVFLSADYRGGSWACNVGASDALTEPRIPSGTMGVGQSASDALSPGLCHAWTPVDRGSGGGRGWDRDPSNPLVPWAVCFSGVSAAPL